MDSYILQIVLVFAGAILPLIGKTLFLCLQWLWRAIFQKDSFTGKWFSYHFTFENGVEVFREDVYFIKLGLGGYRVSIRDTIRPQLIYKGKIKKNKDGSLVFGMYGKGFSEEFQLKMQNHIPNEPRFACALVLAVNFDSRIYSTFCLFSRDELDEDVAKQEIYKRAKKTKSYMLMV